MIEGRTILCFASGYEAPPTSKHHVMHLLAERNRVLWVNYHASRAPSATSSDLAYIWRKLGQVFRGLTNPRENLWVLTPLVLPLPGSTLARRVNRWMLVRSVRRALRRIQEGPLQIWTFAPDVAYLLADFRAETVLYYCVDDFASFSGYDHEQVSRNEEELCRKADLVVACSGALEQNRKSWNPSMVLVRHGVEYGHFARALSDGLTEPEDLRGIPHPRLGFFGLIRDWVDVNLLAQVARLRPEWHIVLIGNSTVDLSPYRGLANMHFLGARPYEQLPAYCKGFDVGLVPFVINDLTRAALPIKLREYLAAGLPVVSTPLPELASLADLVLSAADAQQTVTAVEAALRTNPERRRQLSLAMSQETWDCKLAQIERALSAVADGSVAT